MVASVLPEVSYKLRLYSYGLTAWGQTVNSGLNKTLILQKRALRLTYFSERRTHAIPLFVRSGVLPLNMLYFHIRPSLCTISPITGLLLKFLTSVLSEVS